MFFTIPLNDRWQSKAIGTRKLKIEKKLKKKNSIADEHKEEIKVLFHKSMDLLTNTIKIK